MKIGKCLGVLQYCRVRTETQDPGVKVVGLDV